MRKQTIWSIIFIILILLGITLGIIALHTYSALRINPSLKVTCNFSSFINCYKEVFSKFTKLFGVPIAFIYIVIYSFSLILLVSRFFFNQEMKNVIISAVLFSLFISAVLGIFVTFSTLVLGKYIGVFYPSMFILNLILVLIIYLRKKDYLKRHIFDKEEFSEYKKKINFNKSIAAMIVVLLFAFLNSYMGFSLIKTNVNLRIGLERLKKNIKNPDEKIQELVNKIVKSKSEKVDISGMPSFGSNKKDAVVIIEFSNYACHYCQKFAEDVDKYMKKENKNIKLYVIPINFDEKKCIGKDKSGPCKAVFGAYLAQKKGSFEKYYNYLYLTPGAHKKKVYKACLIAGISKEELEKSYTNPDAIKFVKKVFELGDKHKIEGTPLTFINGKRIDGYTTYKIMKRIIEKLKK